jgi:hypothetical protein
MLKMVEQIRKFLIRRETETITTPLTVVKNTKDEKENSSNKPEPVSAQDLWPESSA